MAGDDDFLISFLLEYDREEVTELTSSRLGVLVKLLVLLVLDDVRRVATLAAELGVAAVSFEVSFP
jgi:hypothetical protein